MSGKAEETKGRWASYPFTVSLTLCAICSVVCLILPDA